MSPLTEARSARRCIGLSKRRPMRWADPSRCGRIQPVFIGWMKEEWGKMRSPRSRGKIKGDYPP